MFQDNGLLAGLSDALIYSFLGSLITCTMRGQCRQKHAYDRPKSINGVEIYIYININNMYKFGGNPITYIHFKVSRESDKQFEQNHR